MDDIIMERNRKIIRELIASGKLEIKTDLEIIQEINSEPLKTEVFNL